MWGKPPTVAYDCDMRETEQPAFALQKLDNIDPSKIWVIRNTIKSDDYQRQNEIKYLNWYFFSIIPPAGGDDISSTNLVSMNRVKRFNYFELSN